MSDKKVDTLIKRIERALEDLCDILDINHITATIIDGSVMIDDYTDLKNQKIQYFKGRVRK